VLNVRFSDLDRRELFFSAVETSVYDFGDKLLCFAAVWSFGYLGVSDRFLKNKEAFFFLWSELGFASFWVGFFF